MPERTTVRPEGSFCCRTRELCSRGSGLARLRPLLEVTRQRCQRAHRSSRADPLPSARPGCRAVMPVGAHPSRRAHGGATSRPLALAALRANSTSRCDAERVLAAGPCPAMCPPVMASTVCRTSVVTACVADEAAFADTRRSSQVPRPGQHLCRPVGLRRKRLAECTGRAEMKQWNGAVTWVDARERLPRSGTPVAAAITGRYPADSATGSDTALGEEFWLVRPMYFTTLHALECGRHGAQRLLRRLRRRGSFALRPFEC
ncbi:AQJ64_40280 family protein [Streptomyces sp. B3I7]|uniref:AQJ64_40280 family protein n=1 Tax=Streptomyces sp. B3I7 TaxID=3042269 RepID=UPI0027D7CC90|nr:AQJ64_40280 family protein [Streptomyces sp. B3I7]